MRLRHQFRLYRNKGRTVHTTPHSAGGQKRCGADGTLPTCEPACEGTRTSCGSGLNAPGMLCTRGPAAQLTADRIEDGAGKQGSQPEDPWPQDRLLVVHTGGGPIRLAGQASGGWNLVNNSDQTGPCRICGEVKELTEEHIPPRAAFNKVKHVESDIKSWLRRQEAADDSRGQVRQGGIRHRTACGKCNNDTGGWYAREYVEWAYRGVDILTRAEPISGSVIDVEMVNCYPLRFLKQCVTMLVQVGSASLGDHEERIRRFILNREDRQLPDEVEIFLALYKGPGARLGGGVGVVNLVSGDIYVLSEVAYAPFAMVLNADAPKPTSFGKINFMRRYSIDERADVTVRFLVGEGHTPYPGDYRDLETVEREAAESRRREAERRRMRED